MAEYMIQSETLDDIADAINAKTGSSSAMTPAEMVTAIGTISGGGGEIRGVSGINVYNYLGVNDADIVINGQFSDLSSLYVGLASSTTKYSVDITAGSKEINYDVFTNGNTNKMYVKKINLHGAKLNVANTYGMRYYLELTELNAKCRVTGSSSTFSGTTKLAIIDFQENQQAISINMSPCPLNNQSLVNVANGLSENVTGKTLTLSSTRKTTCGNIMGRVEEKTVDSSTYHVFVTDDSGTVSLTDFITNTKGWTLA